MPAATHAMCFYKDRITANQTVQVPLPERPRFVFVRKGLAVIDGVWCAEEDTRYLPFGGEIAAGPDGTELWRCEVAAVKAPPAIVDTEGVSSEQVACHRITTLNLREHKQWVFRCDGNDIQPGRRTPPHTHQGPGIRCLIEGGFTVKTGRKSATYAPGDTWWETNTKPVIASTAPDVGARFMRCTILPPNCLGKPITKVVDFREKNDPKKHGKPGEWLQFGEELVTLE